MANVKFSDLSELTAAANDDLLAIVDDSEAAVEKSKKIKFSTIKTSLLVTGAVFRSQFVYKDADEIYIDPGYYDVAGKVAQWASRLTKQLTGASASTWYYLYLDESGITSLTAITATELIWSASAPSWSNTYRGWYNSSDRCIFAVRTNAASQIVEFFNGGSDVIYADAIALSIGSLGSGMVDVDSTWLDVTCISPGFTRVSLVTFELDRNGSNVIGYWRTNGQTGTVGHKYGQVSDNTSKVVNAARVTTDSSQKIEVVHSASNSATSGVSSDGWSFPVGM